MRRRRIGCTLAGICACALVLVAAVYVRDEMMWEAVRTDNTRAASVLLRLGADPNRRVALDDRLRLPLLDSAAMDRDPSMLELLLRHGAEVDARESLSGRTALMTAARFGDTVSVGLLLAHGADPNGKDALGVTPLHYAAMRGRDEAVRMLLASGADPDARDQWGRTPAQLAARRGDAGGNRAVELLRNAGQRDAAPPRAQP